MGWKDSHHTAPWVSLMVGRGVAAVQVLTDSRLRALVRLLDEEEKNVGIVREHLLRAGESALPYLDEAMRSPISLVRDRAQEIAAHLRFDALRDEFVRRSPGWPITRWTSKKGCIWSRSTPTPICVGAYRCGTRSHRRGYSESLSDEMYMEDVIDCINEYLFDREGFRPDNRRFYDPETAI